MSPGWRQTKLGIVAATLGVCGIAWWDRITPERELPEPPPQELYAVILQEVAAVRMADYPRAYRQVSLSMQERYNLDDFADRLRFERSELGRFERIEFGGLTTHGRRVVLPVFFFLRGGTVALVHYTLIREEGAWKIDGSHVDRRWDRSHQVGGEQT